MKNSVEFEKRTMEELREMADDLIQMADEELREEGESVPKFAIAAAPPSVEVALIPVGANIRDTVPAIIQQIKIAEYLTDVGVVSAMGVSTEAWVLLADADEVSLEEIQNTRISEHPDRQEVVIVAVFTPYNDEIFEIRRIERDEDGTYVGLSEENVIPDLPAVAYSSFNPWQKNENPGITA